MVPLLLCPSRVNRPNLTRWLGVLFLAAASPLTAQPDYRGTPREFRHEIQMQLFRFDNFFQARGGAPEENVTAAGFEYGVAWRAAERAPDFFGALYAVNYGRDGMETSFGGRAGAAWYGSAHSFYGYVDHTQNGWAFDIEETTANADITALFANYSYRLHEGWQIGASTWNDRTTFDVETGYEGTYNQLEGDVRYRGFGQIFEPRVGYAIGHRSVENEIDSYDHRHWFVELRTRPHSGVDLSLRYRHRTRDYENVDRSEDRPQVQLRATFRQSQRLAWTMTLTSEDVNSSVPGRDFETSRLFAGVTIGF